MTTNPLYLETNTITYTATDLRQLIAAVLTPGVVMSFGTALQVHQRAAGVNRSVDVFEGSGVVAGTDASNQGAYLVTIPSFVNLPLATAPVTGQSRIDSIVLQVLDADQNGGSTNSAALAVVQGTAATTGSQVAPTLPASSLLLANVLVGPTVTTIVNANITDKRVAAVPVNVNIAPGAVLSQTQYAPGSDTPLTFATTPGAAFDTTHLTTKPFIVPPSGQIVAEVNAMVESGTGSGVLIAALGWLNHSGGAVVANYVGATTFQISGSASGVSAVRVNHKVLITGLTAGATLQLDLAGEGVLSGGTLTLVSGAAGGQFGPTLMTITAA